MSESIHGLATRKAMTRLVPLLFIAYFMAFVDRSNVGLAKTQLEADVGISAAAYGFGAGIFFLSYALLEVPSNLILHKVGARWWIARIAVTWGLISSAMMFTNSATTFYILRFLLGAAEAGLYPGLLYVVTVWFAQRDRARVVGYLLIASSAAYAIGNPIGGLLMTLDGNLGLHGWQWMFLLEGIPAVIIGIVIWFKLPDAPHDAAWLTREEADALVAEAEKPAAHSIGGKIWEGFKNPVVLTVAAIYFLNQMITYGIVFFAPAVIEGLGVTGSVTIGLLAGAVGLGSIAGVLVFPKLLTRMGDEVPLILAACVGLILTSGLFLAIDVAPVRYLMLVCSSFLFTGVLPMFWSIAMARVSGRMAAAVLAFINTIGLTGGFFGPYAFGIAESALGDAFAGLWVVLGAATLSVLLVPVLMRVLRRSSAQGAETQPVA